jgi:hypothetical protein
MSKNDVDSPRDTPGPKNIFFKAIFFVPGPFQGGNFFGGVVYSSARDLGPATLNLRPALIRHLGNYPSRFRFTPGVNSHLILTTQPPDFILEF